MTSEVIWGNLNPRWDQHFVFCPILSKAGSVRIKVMDKDRLMKDDVIGEVSFFLLKGERLAKLMFFFLLDCATIFCSLGPDGTR